MVSGRGKLSRGALWRHPGHLIWALLAYLPFLGRMSVPLTGDQKTYLAIASEMRERGSWLKPYLFGVPNYIKPPFQYWMTLIGWKLAGYNLWGSLLPSVACVLLTAWLLGEIAFLLHEKRWFVNAGLWFAATLGAATYGTVAQMEIYVCLFYTAAWWAALKFLAAPIGERRWRWLYVAFAVAGVSALVKSPLYSVFWVAGFLTYLIISGEWELFRERHLYGAWALGVALGSSWYAAILCADGARFWADYALHETWEKKGGNQGTVASLWLALSYFCFPFTLMAIPAARAIWTGRRTGQLLRFVISWAWPPALFFTFYPYRVKPYLFVLVPMLAVLVDWGYFRVGRTRLFRALTVLSGAVTFLVLGLVAVVLMRAELAPEWVTGGLLLAGLMSLVCASRDWIRGFALSALAAVFFFRAAAVSLGERDLSGLRLVAEGQPELPIAMLDESRNVWHEWALLSVALGHPVRRLEDLDQVTDLLQAGGLVALTDEQSRSVFRTIEAKLLGRGDLREVREGVWPRWKARTKFPYRELISQGRAGVPDFDERTQREFKILALGSKTTPPRPIGIIPETE